MEKQKKNDCKKIVSEFYTDLYYCLHSNAANNVEAWLSYTHKNHHSFGPWCCFANYSTCSTSDNKLYDSLDLPGVEGGYRSASQEHVFRIFSWEHMFLES